MHGAVAATRALRALPNYAGIAQGKLRKQSYVYVVAEALKAWVLEGVNVAAPLVEFGTERHKRRVQRPVKLQPSRHTALWTPWLQSHGSVDGATDNIGTWVTPQWWRQSLRRSQSVFTRRGAQLMPTAAALVHDPADAQQWPTTRRPQCTLGTNTELTNS